MMLYFIAGVGIRQQGSIKIEFRNSRNINVKMNKNFKVFKLEYLTLQIYDGYLYLHVYIECYFYIA